MRWTNTGSATFDARTYATKSQPDNKITLKTTETDHFKPHKELETPLVNVNELLVDYNSTEWTVYLGTSVDPREELKKLYENVKVMEVVKKGQAEDEDHDGLPEIGKTDSDNLWYPLEPDSFSDDRESQGSGEREFYYLKDLIRNLTGENDLDWDSLIDGDVITIPYHVYGINDNSSITIRLNKTVAQGEPGLTPSPHDTAVTGEAVEKYQLIIDYSPDYSVLPKGQGGTSTRDFHTGTYGTIYQGHAAGRETRTNEHTINVFERKLQIEKVDESGNKITGDGEVAYFSIYRKSADGSAVEGLPAGKYEKVADRIATNPADALTDAISLVPTANTDGTETNAYIGTSKTYQKYYIDQTEYYVVEETAPNGYIKAALPSEFDFALSETKTPVVVNEEGEVVLYNWVQAASDSETVKIVKVTNEKMPEKGIIQLEKVWKDHDGNVITSDTGAHPASISYDLYRVKHVHEWETDQPVVDKEATPEEPGLAHYNCKHDGCTVITGRLRPPQPVWKAVLKPGTARTMIHTIRKPGSLRPRVFIFGVPGPVMKGQCGMMTNGQSEQMPPVRTWAITIRSARPAEWKKENMTFRPKDIPGEAFRNILPHVKKTATITENAPCAMQLRSASPSPPPATGGTAASRPKRLPRMNMAR